MLLLLSYKVLGKRNKILNLDYKNISYIELIEFSDNTMTTIKDTEKVKKISSNLNRISGDFVGKEIDSNEIVSFINIYDKAFNKIEVEKKGIYLKFEDNWYKIDKKGNEIISQIIDEYN